MILCKTHRQVPHLDNNACIVCWQNLAIRNRDERIKVLEGALKKYGDHTVECPKYGSPESFDRCICGLREALKNTGVEKKHGKQSIPEYEKKNLTDFMGFR